MQYRKFGSTDLMTSEIGLGCSRLGGNLAGGNERDSLQTLSLALESGINFYDTADSYGQGKSESLLGKAFKNKRDQVILATKAGYTLSAMGSLAARVKPLIKPLLGVVKRTLKSQNSSLDQARGSLLQQDFSSDYLQKSIEGSLKRLQTDYIDLFQLHSPPTSELKSGEAFATLDALQKQGKIRYYGVSCDTLEDALLCLQHPGVASVQIEINLLDQRPIQALLPMAQTQQKAVISRQPFASGKLLKADPELPNTEAQRIQQILQWAKDVSRPITQLSLQYLLQLEGIALVLPGASSPAHLRDNLQALEAAALTASELSKLAAIS